MQRTRILLSFVVCLVLSYLSTLFNKGHNFRKQDIEHKNVCFVFVYNFCLKDVST